MSARGLLHVYGPHHQGPAHPSLPGTTQGTQQQAFHVKLRPTSRNAQALEVCSEKVFVVRMRHSYHNKVQCQKHLQARRQWQHDMDITTVPSASQKTGRILTLM